MRYDDTGISTTILAVIIAAIVIGAGITYLVMRPEGNELSGTITITGSTTVLPIAAAVAEEFMKENPDVEISVTGGGSSVGVTSVVDGTADIGMASRELKSSESSANPDLVKHVVAKDGIAIIVHNDKPVAQLTKESVKKIYNGTATNWKNVGGSLEIPIVVVGRDSASGTRATFDELVLGSSTPVATMEQLASNGEVHDKVASTPGAIGYVGIGYVDNAIKGLLIENDGSYYAPTKENILSGAYSISRDLNMFTKGAPNELVQSFLDYMLGSEGQKIVEDENFIPIGDTATGQASGTLYIAGSTTVLPIAASAAEDFMATNPSLDISVTGGGSSVGITAVGEGTAQIGMASREIKSSELAKYPTLEQHVIAKDGIAVIVNTANTVTQLTMAQIKGIYNGTITNWAEVGGTSGAIVVVGRDSASGTRATFDELVLGSSTPVATMEQLASNGEVHDKVSSTPGAIGYVGLGYVDSAVKGVAVSSDGTTYIAPSVANVQAGTYPISRNLNMFTKGPATGNAKSFIDFIKSPAGQAIVADEGFVPLA